MKELHKGAIFCSLVGQDIGEFMAEILHQASLRDMLENHIGNEGDICGEEKQREWEVSKRTEVILHYSFPFWSSNW